MAYYRRRPPVLTLLALCQFVLAFAVFQGVFAPYLFRELPDSAIEAADTATRALRDSYQELGKRELLMLSVFSGLQTALAIASGVGLLRRSSRFGRFGATAYALSVPIGTALTHHLLRDAYRAAALDFWPRPLLLSIHAAVLLLAVHGPLRRHFHPANTTREPALPDTPDARPLAP